MRFQVFALIVAALFIMSPRPYSFPNKDPRHEGPMNFASSMEPSEAVDAGCEYEYCNSFEVTPTTNCATEVGDPAATADATGTTIVCDETTNGVTDGDESMDLSGIVVAGESQFLHIRDAFDASPLYVQFDMRINGGTYHVAIRDVMRSTDGAETPTDLYPRFQYNYGLTGETMWLQCGASVWGSVNLDYGSLPDQLTIQMDIRTGNGDTQNIRVYRGSSPPVYTDECDSSEANAVKGIKLGKMGGRTSDVQLDNLIVSYTPIPAP